MAPMRIVCVREGTMLHGSYEEYGERIVCVREGVCEGGRGIRCGICIWIKYGTWLLDLGHKKYVICNAHTTHSHLHTHHTCIYTHTVHTCMLFCRSNLIQRHIHSKLRNFWQKHE